MIVLIYDDGDKWNQRVEIKDFENEIDMIRFVNDKKIGDSVMACYSAIKEITIEPFQKVTEYKVKD